MTKTTWPRPNLHLVVSIEWKCTSSVCISYCLSTFALTYIHTSDLQRRRRTCRVEGAEWRLRGGILRPINSKINQKLSCKYKVTVKTGLMEDVTTMQLNCYSYLLSLMHNFPVKSVKIKIINDCSRNIVSDLLCSSQRIPCIPVIAFHSISCCKSPRS